MYARVLAMKTFYSLITLAIFLAYSLSMWGVGLNQSQQTDAQKKLYYVSIAFMALSLLLLILLMFPVMRKS